MTGGTLIIIAIVTVIVALLVFVAISGTPKHGDKRRGTPPGKGTTKKRTFMNLSAMRGGHQFTMSHTINPKNTRRR